MSTTLPIIDPSKDFVGQLLAEQQSMTAVQRFSVLHENGNIAAEPAQSRYYRSLLPASPPSPDQQFAFEVDLDKCSGCKACVVACHTLNGLEDDESWRRVGTLTIGDYDGETLPAIQHVTTACHHCEDPGCLNGCPVVAYEKDPVTGIVRHLDDQCIGCKYCTMMCPYEVPRYSDRLGIVRKCDMCHQRLSVGEAPACVQACPNEAIAITLVDRGVSFDTEDRIAPGAPLSSITKPTTRYQSKHTAAVAGAVPQDNAVDSPAESHWPLAVMLVATQASVGVLSGERLLSLALVVGSSETSVMLTRVSATLALVVAGIGMNVAPLHLGQPLRAWRVFLGLRTSWLSREAVILGQYVGLLAAAVVMLWSPAVVDYLPAWIANWIPGGSAEISVGYERGYGIVTSGLLGLAVVNGLAGLFSSGMIYIATKRVLWRSSRTMIRFFGSAAVLGLTMLAAVSSVTVDGSTTVLLCVIAIAVLVAKLDWEARILLRSDSSPAKSLASTTFTEEIYDRRSKRLVHHRLGELAKARLIAGGVSAGLLLLAAGGWFASPVLACVLLGIATIVLLVGELMERLLYFISVVYDRMPGTL